MRIGYSSSPAIRRLQADAILILVAVIWGSAFIPQRLASGHLHFLTFNGLRFLLGGILVLAAGQAWRRKVTRWELLGGLAAGLLIFGGASLQQAGLEATTAGKAGFITGLYVVLVPVFSLILFRQRTSLWVWLACGIAATGMYLLSMDGNFTLSSGDGLVFMGAFLWALHVILIGKLMEKADTFLLAGIQYLVCAVLCLGSVVFVSPEPFSGVLTSGWTILYVGILSVGVAYTLQLVGQKVAPAADSSIILSLESVFAALFGWIFLKEILTPLQFTGCILILAAMLLAQIPEILRMRKRSSRTVEIKPE